MWARSGAEGRYRALAAVAAFLTLASGGCGTRHRGQGPVTIEVWSGWTGAEADAFQRLVDRFNGEAHGFRVHNLGGVNENSKVMRAITAGVPPDLFTIWDAASVGPLAFHGAIRTLDAEFRAAGFRDEQFVPSALALCRYDGKLIGLPLLMDAYALLWNKRAFREAGLDPERPPATLRELKAYAGRLTLANARGEIARLGLQLPDSTLLCWLHGGGFLDPRSGAPTALTPENEAALTYYRDLVQAMGGRNRVAAFGSGFGAGQGPNNPFFAGKLAMTINGEWIPSWVEKYAPSLEYGVAAVPYDERRPDRKGTTLISVNLVAIPTEAKHPKEAWAFLAWLQRPDVQREFAEALNNIPNVRSVSSEASLVTGSQRRENFGRFCEIARSPNARGFPAYPLGQQYLDELGSATEFVLFGSKTPRKALEDVQRTIDAAAREQGLPTQGSLPVRPSNSARRTPTSTGFTR